MAQHDLPSVGENGERMLVWEYVVRSDVELEKARREVDVLKLVLEDGDGRGIVRGMREVRFARRQRELEEKRKEAGVRSGARGFKARKELKVMEVEVEEERRRLVVTFSRG